MLVSDIILWSGTLRSELGQVCLRVFDIYHDTHFPPYSSRVKEAVVLIVFDSFLRIFSERVFALQFVYVLFLTQCSIQGNSQIYFRIASRFLRGKTHVCVLSGFSRM